MRLAQVMKCRDSLSAQAGKLHSRRPVLLRGLSVLALAMLAACARSPATPPGQPATIILSPSEIMLAAIGQRVPIDATVLDRDRRVITNPALTWHSADDGIATVSESGVVTAVANGTVRISTTSGGVSASVTIVVRQAAAGVTVTPASVTLHPVGATVQLAAMAHDINGTDIPDAPMVWSSSDASVAGVDPLGLATGEAVGEATITAASGDAYGTATIVVTDQPQLSARSSDLVVLSPSVDNDWPAMGTTMILSATISNRGSGSAAATTIRYYRSLDDVISAEDAQVGTIMLSGLAGSSSISRSATLPVPVTPAPDMSYQFYGACVDAVSGESDTTNNCSESVMVRISRPQLAVLLVTAGNPHERNPHYWVAAAVTNKGRGSSAPTTVRFYSTRHGTIVPSGEVVGTDSIKQLTTGGTNYARVNLEYHHDPATHYYGACVDPVPGEIDLSDNCLPR